ncbi:MAG: hypothetical protein LQ337_005737 [Flavoplaca oasis]|nr:MAG: hypothetical protein LQ337_005737 [Flavoplaca oasis]
MVRQSAGLLMSGDAQTGVLYLINTRLRTATGVLQDALLNGTDTGCASWLAHVGVNGIKFYGSDLYFTNTAKGVYGKVRLDTSTGLPIGKLSVIENYGTYLDDLSFDHKGNQYISEPLNGIVFRKAGDRTAQPQTICSLPFTAPTRTHSEEVHPTNASSTRPLPEAPPVSRVSLLGRTDCATKSSRFSKQTRS